MAATAWPLQATAVIVLPRPAGAYLRGPVSSNVRPRNTPILPSRASIGSRQHLYDELYRQAQRQGWDGWGGNERIAEGPSQLRRILANPAVPQRGSALELGCGEGHLCRLLSNNGFTVTGVDVSQVAIAWANSKERGSLIRFLQADLCASEVLPGETFDLIVDGNCLHCITGVDRTAFLQNVRRLLAPGGVLYISILCVKSGAESRTLCREGEAFRYVPTVDSLLRELRQHGFSILAFEAREKESEFNHAHVHAGGA